MSTHVLETQHSHGGAAHGSVKEYVIGLLLSIALTALPFASLMFELFTGPVTLMIILLCAVAQIFVQLIFFLHMNSSSEQIWNTTSAVFIVLIVAILVVGSIWIMEHLNHNMLMGH
jgi:cytochrome o ubiquinol oxidase operon protein cyoD